MPLGHDPPGRGRPHNLITGDNIIVTGGNLTSVQNVYCSPPPNQQVLLDILYPHSSPPRIDARLLHNSKAYEDFQRSSQSPAVDSCSERMIRGLTGDSTNNSVLHHESYHFFRKNYSRAIALSIAGRLAGQGALLASVILPSSSRPCATQYIVPTLAYQLAQNIPASAEYILAAIRQDPCIFERNTETQFTQLIKGPLQLAAEQASLVELAKWPSIIVIDGNAYQFSPGSVPHQVIQLFASLSDIDNPGFRISLVLTSSTTIFDKTTVITLALQQYAGGPACYFTWRVYG